MTALLRPTNDLVAVGWLAGVPGLDPTKVGTTLPRDPSDWTATGFIQAKLVGSAGASSGGSRSGRSSRDVPMIGPIFRVSAYANGGQSKKPPFGKANNLLELVRDATYDESSIRRVDLPGGFPSVRVVSAYFVNEPRRVDTEPSSYARFDVDLALFWVEIVP